MQSDSASKNDKTFYPERIGFAILIGIFFVPVFIFGLFIWQEMTQKQTFDEPKTIFIGPGSSFRTISNILAEEGVVSRAASFRIYVLFRGMAASLKSGRYTFSEPVSLMDVAKRLAVGPGDVEVVIPEGFTLQDIDRRISSFGITEPGAILEASQGANAFNYPFLLSEKITTLEGFLFPDTYRFNQKMKPEDVVRKMLENFQQKVWLKLSDDFLESGESFYALLTMASLLEKEVADPDERRIISGILWRRLELNIPLQVDATVVYAWKQVNPNWKPKNHTLSSQEIKINSPYNTYLAKGLPPAPIANPGFDAILAALSPTETDYWYYLSTRDAKTIFSRTFEEHKEAKAKYLDK